MATAFGYHKHTVPLLPQEMKNWETPLEEDVPGFECRRSVRRKQYVNVVCKLSLFSVWSGE